MIAKNTLDLEMLWVSEAVLADVASSKSLQQIGDLRPLGFDEENGLML